MSSDMRSVSDEKYTSSVLPKPRTAWQERTSSYIIDQTLTSRNIIKLWKSPFPSRAPSSHTKRRTR